MSDIVHKAKLIATEAHAGQKRWGGEDYITHPEAVAKAVAGFGEEYEAAAWLHDILEDTASKALNVDQTDIPLAVVDAVHILTKQPGQSYRDYIVKIAHPTSAAGDIALAVKQADLRHNLQTSANEKNKRRSLRDKWELSLFILERASNLNVFRGSVVPPDKIYLRPEILARGKGGRR